MTPYSRLRCVHDFIASCKRLSAVKRAEAIRQMENFCAAHRDGKVARWPELLALDVEAVLGDASGATLVETMNAMHILPGHRNRGRA